LDQQYQNHQKNDFEELGFKVISIELISNPNKTTINNEFSRWIDTYTKLNVWNLLNFKKIVFLDADVIVLKNIDELFYIDDFGAVYECCDKFNSGVMVLKPDFGIFNDMLNKIHKLHSYDGGDQGFLNTYFTDKWIQLSFKYNAIDYMWPPFAWDMNSIKIVHFASNKPWNFRESVELTSPHNTMLNKLWWKHYKNLPQKHQTWTPPKN